MRTAVLSVIGALLLASPALAQQAASTPESPSLTIYNQNFAVVRQALPLDVTAGINHVAYSDITAHVEPESVVLRDLRGGRLNILEQNYRNDPISQGLLLNLFEGKTLNFRRPDRSIIKGRVIRSGYVPHYNAYSRYGSQYSGGQTAMLSGGAGQPIIEVEGELQFSLPGEPIFPALGEDTILKPTLDWQLLSAEAGHTTAELSYISGGMTWHADYNVVAPENANLADIVGWVTLDNQSGKTFENARIRLMAGDVSKIQTAAGYERAMRMAAENVAVEPQVSEKTFDEYHLYTLERPTTLRDRETKQVEFLRASGVTANRIYVYDGFRLEPQWRSYSMESIRENSSYGAAANNQKVWVMFEVRNSKENKLGMPLPAGRIRFYRRDQNGQMEFTGEDTIVHTPSNETLRIYTGNAFDVVGERKRVDFRTNNQQRWIDESFAISLRNHKAAAIEVWVVEHLYRWTNWEISQNSHPFQKTDAQTIEFRVKVPADGETKITYMAHYSW